MTFSSLHLSWRRGRQGSGWDEQQMNGTTLGSSTQRWRRKPASQSHKPPKPLFVSQQLSLCAFPPVCFLCLPVLDGDAIHEHDVGQLDVAPNFAVPPHDGPLKRAPRIDARALPDQRVRPDLCVPARTPASPRQPPPAPASPRTPNRLDELPSQRKRREETQDQYLGFRADHRELADALRLSRHRADSAAHLSTPQHRRVQSAPRNPASAAL